MEILSKPRWVFSGFVLLGLLLYAAALDNGFYYDDPHQIVENSFIRDVKNIPTFFVDTIGNSRQIEAWIHYRPFLLTTFTLNYAVGGLNPVGYHLVNLFFHVGSAFLVFLILNALLRRSVFPGLAAGLVLLFHPFNSEVVNYVTARSSIMATFFYLLAFYAYIRFRPPLPETTAEEGIRGGPFWFSLCLGAFTLGLLTKEILITFPIVLTLYDWTFRKLKNGSWLPIVWRVTPFLVLTGFYLMARKWIGIGAPVSWSRGLGENLLLQSKALAETWWMLIFPVDLSLIHDLGTPSFWEWGTLGSIVLFLAILGGMGWCLLSSRQGARILGFFLAWFYITLLPTIVIPLHVPLQENRAYIAGVAFAVILGVSLDVLKNRYSRKVWAAARFGFVLLLILYGIGVLDRNRVWDNEMTLWGDTVRKAPASFQSHYLLGMAYYHLGWWDAAKKELLTAVRLNPGRPELRIDLGGLYMRLERPDLAEAEYREALRLAPHLDRAHTNMGIFFRKQGDLKGARKELEAALSIYPYSEVALYQLSQVYREQGDPDRALGLLTYVLKENPNLPKIQWVVGGMYDARGERESAQRAYEWAFRLDPELRKMAVAPPQ